MRVGDVSRTVGDTSFDVNDDLAPGAARSREHDELTHDNVAGPVSPTPGCHRIPQRCLSPTPVPLPGC